MNHNKVASSLVFCILMMLCLGGIHIPAANGGEVVTFSFPDRSVPITQKVTYDRMVTNEGDENGEVIEHISVEVAEVKYTPLFESVPEREFKSVQGYRFELAFHDIEIDGELRDLDGREIQVCFMVGWRGIRRDSIQMKSPFESGSGEQNSIRRIAMDIAAACVATSPGMTPVTLASGSTWMHAGFNDRLRFRFADVEKGQENLGAHATIVISSQPHPISTLSGSARISSDGRLLRWETEEVVDEGGRRSIVWTTISSIKEAD